MLGEPEKLISVPLKLTGRVDYLRQFLSRRAIAEAHQPLVNTDYKSVWHVLSVRARSRLSFAAVTEKPRADDEGGEPRMTPLAAYLQRRDANEAANEQGDQRTLQQAGAMQALLAYHWPRNVRELRMAME